MILAIQENQKKYFEARINPRVMKVSHVQEEKFTDRQYKYLSSIEIISSLNAINVRSVQMFLDLVSVRKSLSTLKIYVAGSVWKKFSCSLPNVFFLGEVDCLNDFYNLADI